MGGKPHRPLLARRLIASHSPRIIPRSPEDFPKVFVLNAPLQVALYLVVACTGYYFQGEAARGYLLDNLPPGGLYRAASGLLFVHVRRFEVRCAAVTDAPLTRARSAPLFSGRLVACFRAPLIHALTQVSPAMSSLATTCTHAHTRARARAQM